MTGVAVHVRRGGDAVAADGVIGRNVTVDGLVHFGCACAGCLVGGICFERYGAVIAYEAAIGAADQRLRMLAQIVAYVASTLAMPRAVVATVRPDATAGTIIAWRLPADADARRTRYVDAVAAIDPFAPVRFIATERTVVSVTDVGGAERLRRTSYGAFLAAGGIEAVGAMYLRHHGRIVACVGLLRELGAAQLTIEELAAAHRLHPLIEAAYTSSLQNPRTPSADDLLERAHLTARECEVVRIAALGARNAEIATALYLSVATVKMHLHRAFAKLGVHSRAELAARLHPADAIGGQVRAR
jgi:DNA-binding CsgD family transcriptional regulator